MAATLRKLGRSLARPGLFPKAVLMTAIAVVVPLAAALLVLSIVLRRGEEDDAKILLANLSQQISKEVLRSVAVTNSGLTSLAGTAAISDRDSPGEEKLTQLQDYRRNFPSMQDLTLIDLEGRVVISTDYSYRGEWRARQVFLEAAAGRPAMSDAQAIQGVDGLVRIQAVPVADSRGQWAVLAGQLTLDDINGALASPAADLHVQAYLLNAGGRFLYHPDASMLLEAWPKAEAIAAGGASGAVWLEAVGEERLCAYQQAILPNKLGDPWKVVVCQSKKHVLLHVATSQRVLLGTLVGALALSLAIGFVFSRTLTAPIRRVALAAGQLAQGDYRQRAPEVWRQDEVGEMARSFNTMAETVERTVDELRRQRDTLSAIQESIVEGLVVLDAQGREMYRNRALGELTGMTDAETLGRPLREILDQQADYFFEDRKGYEALMAAIRDVGNGPTTVEAVMKNPRRRVLSATVFPIHVEGRETMAGLLLRDVTQEREMENRRDTFVAIASHELRTPLTTIVGFSELLLQRDPSEAKRKEWLQRIYTDSRRIMDVINDVLDVSRIQTGTLSFTPEPVVLTQVIEDALAAITPITEVHQFAVEVGPDIPELVTDRLKLLQVLVNLLSNAVKYSPRGGPVTVAARLDLVHQEVVVSVADRGIGIAPEDMGRLFSSFERISRPETVAVRGTGLGLYIVKGLVELLGGRVWAESQLNHGSVFYFTVPISPKQG